MEEQTHWPSLQLHLESISVKVLEIKKNQASVVKMYFSLADVSFDY